MARIFTILAALALALGLITTALADSTSSNPIPLTGSYSNSIVGSSAGAFQYYGIDYPGKNTVGTIAFSFTPTDPSTANAFGINVIQGITTLATEKGASSTPGTQSISFQSATPGPVLVQVYNYNNGVSVNYSLNLTGITTTSTGAPIPTPTATPASSTNQSVSGTLVGSSGGAYASITVPYTAGAAQAAQISWSSPTPNAQAGLWVVAYQNGNKVSQVHVSDESTPGNFSFFFNAPGNGPVLIQLGNYTPGSIVNYTLSP